MSCYGSDVLWFDWELFVKVKGNGFLEEIAAVAEKLGLNLILAPGHDNGWKISS